MLALEFEQTIRLEYGHVTKKTLLAVMYLQ